LERCCRMGENRVFSPGSALFGAFRRRRFGTLEALSLLVAPI
jgi:hypothetical protein